MSLPGKLCVGILEEDNPFKAYFRFKPLLVEADGRYVPYTDGEAYPAEGCIRIVPDKNEAFHFKARMRRMGLFCVVDLRAHPDDNDKIRPNKNYRKGASEQNAFIIYSDVVHEPVPGSICEILTEAAPEEPRPWPHTAAVLLAEGDTVNPERYEWESDPEREGRAALRPTGKTCDLSAMQQFALEGFQGRAVRFVIAPPAAARPALPRREDGPVANVASVANDAHTANAAHAAPATHEANAPRDALPARGEETAEAPADARREDKPWLHRDDTMLPQPPDPRLTPAQRILASQSGMNPRRGRSLQELIDEKWQVSRLNQLGQPVSPIQTGAPVASPVDNAVRAVQHVWAQPQLRGDLLSALGGIEEFGASLEECREAARQRDIEQHLDELEARRLALLGELDHLNLQNAEVRAALKEELRRDEASGLAEAVKRTKAARAEQAKYEKLAGDARAAAEEARKAADALSDDAIEDRIREFALNHRILARVRRIEGEAEPLPPVAPALGETDLNGLAQRLASRFDAAGRALDRAEALNLCACAAVAPTLILSGPVGSGKTEAARLLAEALGWANAGRFARFAPGEAPLDADPRLKALEETDAPALLLLDDANLVPAADPLRGLDGRLRDGWRLCLTLQDGGRPLPCRALDRGFTVRLAAAPRAPWKPCRPVEAEPLPPVSLRIDVPMADLPAAIQTRMEALLEGLDKGGAAVSRRALDDAWRYCALMLQALGADADPTDVLDRAVAQRVLPPLLAAAPLGALKRLPALLEGLPRSRALLDQPLPVMMEGV